MIYIVEDDSNIRELVLYALRGQGYEAVGFGLPSEFWEAMRSHTPELILLDIMLPEEDGLAILRRLRTEPATRTLPIMMLTAKSTEYDAVLGLDSGADDYIAKPFRMMEMLSRVRALLRRSQPQNDQTLSLGCLTVSTARHEVLVHNQPILLTLKEFDLLLCFLENPGLVLTRSQLLSRIWGYSFDGESRTVDVHVGTLRQKLGDAGQYIRTVRGVGYRLEENES